MMNQRNVTISKGVDSVMIWLYIALVAIGIFSIFSVTYRENVPAFDGFFKMRADYGKQTLYFIISLILGLFILLTDSKFFTATANIWYAFGIFLLLLVFPFHTEVKGTESIIRFGGFQLQPAELCKVFVNLALAKYLSRVETDFTKPRSQLIAAGIVLLPAIITIAQKETGLALVFFAFFLVMFVKDFPPGTSLLASHWLCWLSQHYSLRKIHLPLFSQRLQFSLYISCAARLEGEERCLFPSF